MPRKEAEDHVDKDSTGELKRISFFPCVASGNITELKLKSLLLPNDILRYLKHNYKHGFLPYPSNSFFPMSHTQNKNNVPW